MKKVIYTFIAIAFMVLLIPTLTGYKTGYSLKTDDYKNIKNSEIRDCSLVRNLNTYTYTSILSDDDINEIVQLLNSSEDIIIIKRDMPRYSSCINVNLKTGKTLKLIYSFNTFIFTDNGIIYKVVQPKCKEFMQGLFNKYAGAIPDRCDLVYVYNLFGHFQMNLTSAKDYNLILNKMFGRYYNINSESGIRVGIYTYSSEQEMHKGLEEYKYKSSLINIPYRIVYSAKNVIIIILVSGAENKYINRISSLIDYINGNSVHITIAWNNNIYEMTEEALSTQSIGEELGSISRQVSPMPERNGDIARNTADGPPIIHNGGGKLYEIKGSSINWQIALDISNGLYYRCTYLGKLER